MLLSSSFEMLSFQRKVQDALQSVERTLELERKPRLAADVDHTYGTKYGLVDLTSNAAIIAYVNCFEKLGLDVAALKSIDKTKPATLRFETSISCTFLKDVKVDVPLGRSYEEKEETKESGSSKDTFKTKVMKAVNHVTEFHWQVGVDWSISIYSGTSIQDKKVIKSRTCKTTLITQTNKKPESRDLRPIELSLTWLLQQINTVDLASQFKVDTEGDGTKTPRRNDEVQKALEFATHLMQWCERIETLFIGEHLRGILERHNPALPKPQTFTIGQLLSVEEQYSIFNPILPLMEENRRSEIDDSSNIFECKSIIRLPGSNDNTNEHETLLSLNDISGLLNEHVRTLEEALGGIEKSWPSDSDGGILSSAEASLTLITTHLRDLSSQYTNSMSYVESMVENQLIAAIGKRLTPHDLDKFVKFHNARLLQPMPQPFSHAVRRPKHYPVGLLSIESKEGENAECIHSHSREVNSNANLKIPLNAATVIKLTGQQYLHGYMNHRFGASHKSHQLVARARQFSAFILVVGTMTDSSTLDPKDAIIVQNKDELLIPLLLEEMPTAKEFKDAVKSLSPEQQCFARAYRKMQLASSIFGICVIQIKPQLEALLGLPADALDKEMKLTQDLMELFIEYQVPSDLLSYNSYLEDVATEDKISNVRDNVKSVLDVINAEKEKQQKMEKSKADMAKAKAVQSAPSSHHADLYDRRISAKLAMQSNRGAFELRSRRAAPQMMSMQLERMAFLASEEMADDRSLECNIRLETPLTQQAQISDQQGDTESKKNGGEKAQLLKPLPDQVVDFTLIPQALDAVVEKSGEGNALRSTTIKTGNEWVRNRQENLLTSQKQQKLNAEEVTKEKNKAFDLLDALSRSGSLSIAYSDLHVVVAVTHCFDKDVMSTVVCDNIKPIEKLECSTLLLASAVHGVPARELIGDANEMQRLECTLPLLLEPSGVTNVQGPDETQD